MVIWDGQVLDGRNRLAACELASVEPLTRTLKACPDPVAFVLSANLRRRHLRHIDRVRLAWLRKRHWQDVLKRRQAEAGVAGSEGGRGKKKTLQGNPPEGLPRQQWFDLAAKETEVKGDAVKTYDEVMAAECPALSAPPLSRWVIVGSPRRRWHQRRLWLAAAPGQRPQPGQVGPVQQHRYPAATDDFHHEPATTGSPDHDAHTPLSAPGRASCVASGTNLYPWPSPRRMRCFPPYP